MAFGHSGLACRGSRRLEGSWQGHPQKGDALPKPRKGDGSLAIPRLQARRIEGAEGRFYVIDGATFPSATTIIGVVAKPGLASWSKRIALEAMKAFLEAGADMEEALALAEGEPERQRDIAAGRGALAHEAVALALAKRVYPSEWGPLVRAALSFLADYGLHPLATETLVVSKRRGFAGTIDLVARRDDGSLVLADWKTGPLYSEHALQLGAYAIALEEMTGRPVGEAYVVGLREKGYEAKRVNLPLAKRAFLACLTLWRALRGELYE
jgi:hypothetical protein